MLNLLALVWVFNIYILICKQLAIVNSQDSAHKAPWSTLLPLRLDRLTDTELKGSDWTF